REAAQQTFEAMVSILAQAYWHGRPPAELKALSVDEALKRISDPAVARDDRMAGSRRRRAIATLAGYGLRVKSIEAALKKFGVPVDALARHVEEQEALLGAVVSENAEERVTFIADLPEVRTQTFASTADTATTDTSCWSKLSSRVYPGRETNIVVDIQ